MTALADRPARTDTGLRPVSFAFATLGFLGSTFLTATVMVLLSAL